MSKTDYSVPMHLLVKRNLGIVSLAIIVGFAANAARAQSFLNQLLGGSQSGQSSGNKYSGNSSRPSTGNKNSGNSYSGNKNSGSNPWQSLGNSTRPNTGSNSSGSRSGTNSWQHLGNTTRPNTGTKNSGTKSSPSNSWQTLGGTRPSPGTKNLGTKNSGGKNSGSNSLQTLGNTTRPNLTNTLGSNKPQQNNTLQLQKKMVPKPPKVVTPKPPKGGQSLEDWIVNGEHEVDLYSVGGNPEEKKPPKPGGGKPGPSKPSVTDSKPPKNDKPSPNVWDVIGALPIYPGGGGNRPGGYQPPQNNGGYYPPQPNYNPLPANPPSQTVTKNVIVPKKKLLAKNQVKFTAFDREAAVARTDAEQIAEAGEIEQQGTVVIHNAVAASGNNDMMNDWTAYLENPSTEALQKFRDKWGATLGPKHDEFIGSIVKASQYQDDLLPGTLTSEQKDRAIADLEASISANPPGPVRDSMVRNIDRLRNLNDLGKLAEATQNQDNGLETLLAGAQSAGYPPSFVGEMVGMPLMDGQPMPDKPAAVSTGKTCLLNPENTGNTINYSLNEYPYSMAPGQSQYVDGGYVVAFDNGRGAQRQYTLMDGSYRFIVGPQGWDLKSTTFKVTIDNSSYSADFNFSINDEPGVVRAGQAVEVQSPYPVEISFDRGDGGEPARKRLTDGTYQVGLNASQRHLELYDEGAIKQQEAGALEGPVDASAYTSDAQRRADLILKKLKARAKEKGNSGTDVKS
jgi:hypothetical protein